MSLEPAPEKLSEISKTRLLKMADFLDTLTEDQFRFTIVRGECKCGTVGCISGWMPSVFPQFVQWHEEDRSFTVNGSHAPYGEGEFDLAFMDVFGVSEEDAEALTRPYRQDDIGLPPLGSDAKPHQAASMLRAYVSARS